MHKHNSVLHLCRDESWVHVGERQGRVCQDGLPPAAAGGRRSGGSGRGRRYCCSQIARIHVVRLEGGFVGEPHRPCQLDPVGVVRDDVIVTVAKPVPREGGDRHAALLSTKSHLFFYVISVDIHVLYATKVLRLSGIEPGNGRVVFLLFWHA